MILKKALAERGKTITWLSNCIDTDIISRVTLFKYQDDPERYSVTQLKHFASKIGIDHTELLIDLELI